MQQLSRVWYSWIPTNLGEINPLFFGKSKNVDEKLQNARIKNNRFFAEKIDISFISDTHYFLSKWLNPLAKTILPTLEDELFGFADIKIEEKKAYFFGKIELYYPEHFQASAFFDLEHTGKIRIYGVSLFPKKEELWKNFSNKEEFLDYLAQVIFIIIKTIVHGDNHHHQKIDTAIEVKRGKFDPIVILKTMIQHIKRVEHDTKNMDKCIGRLKAKNTIEELKGYRSYIRTFRSLFLQNIKSDGPEPLYTKDPSILDNLIDSTEATVNKWINTPTYFSSFLSILLVYMALSVSGAILYNNLTGGEDPVFSDWGYYRLSLLALMVLMTYHLKCSVYSWLFYKYYAFFEYLYYVSAYEHPRRWQDAIIKNILKFRNSLFFLVIAFVSWNFV
ncbi:hypothetical protein [Hydrogenimonas sp.]